MPPEPRDPAYLLDMLEAAEKIRRYVYGKTYHDYSHDEMLRDAVERNVQNIGEAAHAVSKPFRQAHPQIPWRKIIAQRNVLVHEYGDIEPEDIWQVATIHIPDLIRQLAPLIPPIPKPPSHGT